MPEAGFTHCSKSSRELRNCIFQMANLPNSLMSLRKTLGCIALTNQYMHQKLFNFATALNCSRQLFGRVLHLCEFMVLVLMYMCNHVYIFISLLSCGGATFWLTNSQGMCFLPLVSNECSFQTFSILSLIVLALSFTPLVLQTQQFVAIFAANQSKNKLYLHWLPKLAQAFLGRTPTPTMDQIRKNWTLESKHIFRPNAPI